MKKTCALVIAFVLAFPAIAGAKDTSTRSAPSHNARQVPTPTDPQRPGLILRQDLFDRNNPNNLRSDWPGAPAQPGQF